MEKYVEKYVNLSNDELGAIFDAVEYRRIEKERLGLTENVDLLRKIASDINEQLSKALV